MSDRPTHDPRFLGGESFVLTDTSKMAFTFVIDYEGVADMQAGDGISKAQAALWLRAAADSLDPEEPTEWAADEVPS
jgi:hypothetical protein